jgi:phenylacetic acid degradation protein
MVIPARSIVVGNPAKIIKEVSDEMIAWKTAGTKLYQQLPTDCYNTLKECEPLREIDANRPKTQENLFKTWNDSKGE